MKYALYSPGYGSGWSTWIGRNREETSFSLFYQPIIDALLNKEPLIIDKEKELGYITDKFPLNEIFHPSVCKFHEEFKEKFGTEPYLGGIDDVCLYEIPKGCLIRVTEHDGNESVELRHGGDWY